MSFSLVSKKFFVFDLDGTLFNTLPDLAPAVNVSLQAFGLEPLSYETICSYIGNGSKNLIRRSLGDAPVSLDAAHQVFLDYYKEHCTEKTKIMPGVLDFFKTNKRVALLTNKPILPTKLILSHFGFAGFFESVLGGDTAIEKKPSPQGILQILKNANVRSEDAVMIGDDVPDLLAAKNAGIDSVLILNGFGKRENILPYSPENTVEHFSDLLNLIS